MHTLKMHDGRQNNNKGQNAITIILLLFCMMLLPAVAFAATSGDEFKGIYDFVFEAASGYLGRAIAIAGGLIGLGFGAATGRPVIAVVGIVLAVFGSLGPAIINTIFSSALI